MLGEIVNKSKLTKEGLKGFSIPFSRAKAMGITDDDLLYISELNPDKFRISIRDNTKSLDDKDRHTKVAYDLTEAINVKWEIYNAIERAKLFNNKTKPKMELYKYFTVSDGIKLFVEHREHLIKMGDIEFTTHETDLTTIEGRFIRDSKLLPIQITKVTVDEAQEFVNDLWKATSVQSHKLGEELSENTIYHPFGFMRKLFEYFKEEIKIIEVNPFVQVKNKPKYTPKKQNHLITEEIHYLFKHLENKNIRFKCFVNLILETGLRIEEITAIKWSDISRLRRTIEIIRALRKSKKTGELIIKDVKTKTSEREVSISNYIIGLLDNYRSFKEACGITVTNDDFIFTAWDSNDLVDPVRYSEEWKRFVTGLGFKNLPLKNARHTNATFMLQDNPNIKAVQQRLGHAKPTTTLGIYSQSNIYEDRKLVEKFEKEFRNSLGVTIADLYRISVNRLNNKRRLNKFLQDLTGKFIDDNNYDKALESCQKLLFNFYPVFNKISKIDNELDDEEIEAVYDGFTHLYSDIKLDPTELDLEL